MVPAQTKTKAASRAFDQFGGRQQTSRFLFCGVSSMRKPIDQSALIYSSSPYGNLNWKPMSPRTKTKVKYVRWMQLFFRICALLAAMGMLVCVICIKGTNATEGWIIRVPVCIITLAKCCTDSFQSLVWLSCTQPMQFIIWLGLRKDERQHHQLAT